MARRLTEGKGSREGEEETDAGIGGHSLYLSTICKTPQKIGLSREQPRRVLGSFEGGGNPPLSPPARPTLTHYPRLSVPAPLETTTENDFF